MSRGGLPFAASTVPRLQLLAVGLPLAVVATQAPGVVPRLHSDTLLRLLLVH